ncbi:hypothetical protein [Benzoatithermus flavus]|uniref:Sporulation related domain-containing protein n=1 Tax=Benzoatithermus flavus TaxID=3108223 RepID=A0ABU8XLV8_9PROT
MRRSSDPARRRLPEDAPEHPSSLRPTSSSPTEPPRSGQRTPPPEIVGGDPALAAALERCAARDPVGLAELRAWQGGRLRETLLRTLGDPVLADRALEGALADLWDNAALHHTLGRGPAEDRVFAVLRRHAHALLRERGSPVPAQPPSAPLVRSVPPTPAPYDPPQPPPCSHPASTMPASPVAASPEPMAAPVAMPLPDAEPLPATRRLRRPDAATSFHHAYPQTAHEHGAGRNWRRWLFLLLAWIVAAGTGFGLAFVAFQLSGNRDATMLWFPEESPSPSAVAPAPQPPPRPVETSPRRPPMAVPKKPSAQGVGEPLKAPEPPAVALRPLELQDEPATLPGPPPAAPDPALAIAPAPPAPVPRPRPAVEARLPAEARIFVHFTAGDDASAARAEALQNTLQRRGADSVQLVPVRFPIGTASVRYFYPEDRLTAERLLQGARNELATDGRPAPGEPTDFTRFRPSPRPGTIEVWLPGG